MVASSKSLSISSSDFSMSSSDMVQETWWCADGYLLAFRIEVGRLASEGMWVMEEALWVWW